MKLIIDISEGIYKHVDTIQNGSIGAKQIINSVKNGIPAYNVVPSAEPKTGHWIVKDEESAVCPFCCRNNKLYGDYCKWCGAKMVESQERSK